MPDILKHAAEQVIVIDGAMGTMLHRMGLAPGESPELLNVAAPEMIAEVHGLYVTAGLVRNCLITSNNLYNSDFNRGSSGGGIVVS